MPYRDELIRRFQENGAWKHLSGSTEELRMSIPKITIVVGAVLIIQGIGFFVATNAMSVTALIPAFVGVPILALGTIALKDSVRRHAMHIAAVLAMLGFLAAAGRMVSAGVSFSAAGTSLLLLALLTGGLLLLYVKSFVDARRRQRAAQP